MRAALQTGATTEPTLRCIFLSEDINRRSSGAVVKPWEVDDLPEEFILAYQTLFREIGNQKKKKRMEGLFLDFRRKHPTYRKYVN